MKYFAIAALLLLAAAAKPAAAQTARIAHFSHSGSLAELERSAEPDNFGIPSPDFVEDSLRLTSDTTALAYGYWRMYSPSSEKRYKEKTRVVVFGRGYSSKDKRELVRYYQEYHPKVKLIGFDSTAAPANVPPGKTKQKNKRKKAVSSLMLPGGPPPHSGVWLGMVLFGLAGIGWLLGERRPDYPQPV